VSSAAAHNPRAVRPVDLPDGELKSLDSPTVLVALADPANSVTTVRVVVRSGRGERTEASESVD